MKTRLRRFDRDAVERRRAEMNLTQKELAEPSPEHGLLRGPKLSTIQKALQTGYATAAVLHQIARRLGANAKDFELPAGSGDEPTIPPRPVPQSPLALGENALAESIRGVWSMFHFTRRPKNDELPTISELTVSGDGSCLLHYLETRFEFAGNLHEEHDGRFVIVLDCTTPGHCERLVIRSSTVIAETMDELQAVWLGVDFNYDKCCSKVLLTKERIPVEPEARQQAKRRAAAKIASMEVPWVIGAPELKVLRDQIAEIWNINLVREALADSVHGEIVTFFSTHYQNQEFEILSQEIESLYERITDPSDAAARLKVQVLFLDLDRSDISEFRFQNFPDPGAGYFQYTITQVKKLLSIADRVSGRLNLEVYFHRCWPFGHCYVFGARIVFLGTLWPDNSAITGPMIVSRDPHSGVWRKIALALEVALSAANCRLVDLEYVKSIVAKRPKRGVRGEG